MQWRIKEYFDMELGGTRYIVQYGQFFIWHSVKLSLFQQVTFMASDFNNYDLVGKHKAVGFCKMEDALHFTYDHERYIVRKRNNKPVYHSVVHYPINLKD
jgi:hypothetical protein